MITIQKFKKNEVNYILKWFANPDNRRYQNTKIIDLEKAKKLIATTKNKKVFCIKLNEVPIGYCMIKGLPKNPEIGITIDKKFWGQGFGKEAMFLLENEARKIGINKIGLIVKKKNQRAINLYKKLKYKDSFIIMEKELN